MVSSQIDMPHAPTGRQRFDAMVIANQPLCREHFLLSVRLPGDAFPPTRPGQFIQIGCRTPDGAIDKQALLGTELEWQPGQPPQLHQPELCSRLAMLRRPFSLAGRRDTDAGVELDIIHRVVGTGTDWLSHLSVGDAVDLIGPLGNAFELPADKSIGLMVGGGVGLPPMFYLAEAMAAAKWQAVGFVGALCRDLLAVSFDDAIEPSSDGDPTNAAKQFAIHGFDSVITTDDGSLGLKGRITDGLSRYMEQQTAEQRSRTVVYTCGPEPMMHAVARLAEQHDVNCQVCLEQAMACGMGTCQSCVVKIEQAENAHGTTPDGRPWRYNLACTDGPVFRSGQVIW